MSSWLAVDDDPDEDGDERFLIHERLVRDDGLVLGAIMRFYDCGPTYAWSQHGRIGACSPAGEPEPSGWACDAAARRVVERALEASTSSGETGGGELPG
jgi:hypothetical protein